MLLRFLTIASSLLLSMALHVPAGAQPSDTTDRVSVRQPPRPGDSGWYSDSIVEYSGQIEEFDEQKLLIRTSDGQLQRLASNQVESVDIAWTEPAMLAAMELVEQREYRKAVTALDEARKGLPTWKQRFAIDQIVQTASALGNPRTAGILFLNLAQSKPPDLLYGNMPLCWTVTSVDRPLAEAAAGWLKSDDEAAKLLGASWLLLSNDSAEAKKIVEKLRQSESPVISQLAVAQSWRLVAPPETASNLESWFQFRDKMDAALQVGPTEFLADRLQRTNQLDLALGEWSRIASVPGGRYDRALRALQGAAENLQRAQRPKEVEIIKRWIEQLEGT